VIDEVKSAYEWIISHPQLGYVLSWPLVALLAFAGVQRIKRLALAMGRQLGVISIELTAVFSCLWIGLAIQWGLFNLDLRYSLINTLLIAWSYMATIRYIMRWAKLHDEALYYALKTDRRRVPPEGGDPDQTYF
jgi:biotin transporter BioY